MRKRYLLIILSGLFIISCQTKPKSLQEQLTANFAAHLNNTDSILTLDSLHVLRVDTITERAGRIIDDSIYSHEKKRLELQLNSARASNDADSIAFVQYEIDYMQKEIDSIKSSIDKADVQKKYGIVVICTYSLTKNSKSKTDSIFYFIDTKGQVMNSDMIDEFIKRTAKQLY